jgi:prepilin-type N-terminal cleavage/methylation domain-containing protein
MKSPTKKETCGFTLLELTMATAILSVISLLTLVVINSANSTVALSLAKDEVQASVRDVLIAMTMELELASKKSDPALTPALQALTVPNASNVVFQVPAGNTGTIYSQPITYTFVNEDANNNGLLNTGEDTNGDGALTRCVRRTQAGATQTIGAANNLSGVQFALNAARDVLTITVSAAVAVNNPRHDLARATASSSVYLHN